MKVSAKVINPPPAFKPVELTITFQTEEELNAFSTMCSYTRDIPKLIHPTREVRQAILSKVLQNIHEGLIPLNY